VNSKFQTVNSWFKLTFRSLSKYNYRLWAIGSLVSNSGTWMQRIAQDWLVLTQLTQHSGASVGIVMSLQFGPPILLMPWTGMVADKFDRRKLLIITQSALAVTSVSLGILVLTEVVTLWQVYLFAAIMGCISSFDSPVRQTFVTELVGEADLPNAVALNSTLFNSAQLIGPAIAGVLIIAIGMGWLFVINGLSFVAVIYSLIKLRKSELNPSAVNKSTNTGIVHGLRYLRGKPDLLIALTMLFILGTYGLNFPIFISTMAVTTFNGGPHLYGALSSCMAVGSVMGALYSARSEHPRVRLLAYSALGFGVAGVVASLMPNIWLFGLSLIALGATAQTFTISTNSLVQLRTDPALRGRVMAIYMAIFMGCTPLGAPLIGWIADLYGPRWAIAVGAASGFIAATIGLGFHLLRKSHTNTKTPK